MGLRMLLAPWHPVPLAAQAVAQARGKKEAPWVKGGADAPPASPLQHEQGRNGRERGSGSMTGAWTGSPRLPGSQVCGREPEGVESGW